MTTGRDIIAKKLKIKDVTITYGIGAIQEYRLVAYVLGISDDEEKVKGLVKKFNQEKTDIKYFMDITKGDCVI